MFPTRKGSNFSSDYLIKKKLGRYSRPRHWVTLSLAFLGLWKRGWRGRGGRGRGAVDKAGGGEVKEVAGGRRNRVEEIEKSELKDGPMQKRVSPPPTTTHCRVFNLTFSSFWPRFQFSLAFPPPPPPLVVLVPPRATLPTPFSRGGQIRRKVLLRGWHDLFPRCYSYSSRATLVPAIHRLKEVSRGARGRRNGNSRGGAIVIWICKNYFRTVRIKIWKDWDIVGNIRI